MNKGERYTNSFNGSRKALLLERSGQSLGCQLRIGSRSVSERTRCVAYQEAHGSKRAGRKPNPAMILLNGTSRATLLEALSNVDPNLVSANEATAEQE